MKDQFEVRDDGTLDTVIACRLCDREYRFTFQAELDGDMTYAEYRDNCIDDIREEHDCDDHD